MSIPFSGAGSSGAGSTFAGFGTPAAANIPNFNLYKTVLGNNRTCRLIDPISKDYVLDDFGNFVGQTNAQQLVYLALVTARDSSILSNFGLDIFNVQVIKSDTLQNLRNSVNEALRDLIS